jgi:carboxypeptidase Q
MPRRVSALLAGLLLATLVYAADVPKEVEKAPEKAAASADAAKALDQKIMADLKAKSEIVKNLTHMCDFIGGRLTGSPALKKANDWTAEMMKSYGLENVHLEPYEIPIGWERGICNAKLVEPDTGINLVMCSAGWAPGTHGKIVGDVVIFKATKREDLEKYKGKLKNAIILQREPRKPTPAWVNDPTGGIGGGRPRGPMGGGNASPMGAGNAPAAGGAPPTPDKTPPAPAKTPAAPAAAPPAGGAPPADGGGFGRGGFNNQFAQELRDFFKAEGVAAVLSDSNKPQGLLVTTGGWRGKERAAEQEGTCQLFVANEHYALLWRLASRPAPAKTRVELEVTNKFIPGPITVYNTVGEIKGSEKPDEFVIVGAHLDSWDLAQGATDNGTGSMLVLETARVLAKCGVKPKRTVRFCLFSGEEQGLHGSRNYADAHKDELAKCSMVLVHDTGTGKVQTIGLQGREVLKPILDKELASLQEVGVKEISTRSMGGTDHLSFERLGVPGFACLQDMNEYRFTHHTQTDTVDKVNEENLIQGAQVMAVSAMRVANLDKLLPRDRPQGQGQRRPGGGGE